MSVFGDYSADVLAGTVEKLVAKMDEGELAAQFGRDLPAMPGPAFDAFVEAAFDAFRDRGESSEDVVEGAGTSLAALGERKPEAVAAMLAYASANAGVLKEAIALFVEEHPDFVSELPTALRSAIAERLAQAR
ncbi:MAG TPA: hypothetical protein VMH02_07920 [Verrucomicrobiae bacterium]|nr:hypothetical protein [Verrucomicrobiae bacterium]